MGAWCGYVAVPPGHPWHGVHYNECVKGCATVEPKPIEQIGDVPVPDSIQKAHMERKHFACRETFQSDHTPELIINVHGGLTYSDFCSGHICHVPKPGEPDNVFWFGFDCSHGGDVIPSFREFDFKALMGETYKDVAYVRAQVEHLAGQLKTVA